ncbi:hypothetical protein Mterra_02161 [Calidithermus terrae]|uniref:DUF2946 domain-containing protein n=1 Tax=Calidithermus terrae TaxID=1408545 RepID=A0A399EMV8_9DEIN|nr:hypothetical protein [Calidithermus terrae]RIH83812.1 hypothetical protein Mterra_02161 [Calidithermus terrae]
MRPSLPRFARQPVTAWALALLLLGASSLIHVCEYLTASHPHLTSPAPEHSHGAALPHAEPAGKPHPLQAHAHLGECALCVAHAIQVAPPAQVPGRGLFLLALSALSASALVPGPVRLLPYSPRAPPRALFS